MTSDADSLSGAAPCTVALSALAMPGYLMTTTIADLGRLHAAVPVSAGLNVARYRLKQLTQSEYR